MKKTLSTLIAIMVFAVTSTSAYADFLLGGDIEANAWMPSVSVDGQKVMDDEVAYTLQGTIEHVVPLIPNVLVSYSRLSETNFDYSKTDLLGYYEILDNDIASIDIGLGMTALSFNELKTDTLNVKDAIGYLPTAYASVEVGIPATPLFIYTKAFLSGTHENFAFDGSVGLQYEISLTVVDVEIQGGYRVQDYKFDDLDSNKFDTKLDGFFVGVNLDF